MAAFPCPYCGHALVADDENDETKLERCPSCDGSLLIAYRYRLIAAHGSMSGGELYRALDDGFDEQVAVLFVEAPDDAAAVERFIEGSRLFADLGGRGLIKIHEVGTRSDARAYLVMDWIEGGTLEGVVRRRGAIDQATLIELVGDLLTGLSKAHRSMPAIVHGHIHPGKIGFRRGDEIVLFGFERARQVRAQDSQLADSFGADEPEGGVSPASDLRQLGSSIHYAATGQWLGELGLADQRERVRAELPGPLGRLVDRMLGAGADGYKSAVEAAIDFEQLMRGQDTWRARSPRPLDRSRELMGTAWELDGGDGGEGVVELVEDAGLGEGLFDVDESEGELGGAGGSTRPEPPPMPAAAPDYRAWAAQRQVEALAAAAQTQKSKSSAGRAVLVGFGLFAAIATCVATTVAGSGDEVEAPPPPRFEPRPPRVSVPEPAPPVELPEHPDVDELIKSATLAGTYRHTGTVTGPEGLAGLALGTECEVWVEPVDGAQNCRWYIDCGQPRRRIYGGGNVGYSQCEVEDGRPIRAQDEEDDAADGAFLADFSTRDRMVIVQDRWLLPPVRVVIGIEGEGRVYDGGVPEVELAPRVGRERITERVEAGDLPVIEVGVVADWGG